MPTLLCGLSHTGCVKFLDPPLLPSIVLLTPAFCRAKRLGTKDHRVL